MCEPVSMTILAVASTAASVYTQIKSAEYAEDAIRDQLANQEVEIADAEVAEINDRMRAARKEQGRVRAAAGEAGLQLTGSVEGLLKDTLMQSTLYNERAGANAERQLRAGRSEANSMLSRTTRPSALGAGLQVVSAGASAYGSAKSAQVKRETAASST